jgi:membrane-bound ClpP family serine protease
MVAAAAARKSEVDFSYRMAAAFDLSGRDVVATVQDLIHAKEAGLREQADEVTSETVNEYIGAMAEVVHAVGPPGLVSVGDKLVNAVAIGGYVPKGATVRVIGTKDNMVVVEKTAE